MRGLRVIIQTLGVKWLLILILFGIMAFFTLEFGFELKPCKLCILQRIPYYIALLCVLVLPPRYAIYPVLACFICAFFIAIFNIAVEEGVVNYVCNSSKNADTIESLRSYIYNTLPECTLKSKIFGMRVTILSLIYDLILILSCVFLIKRRK
jgi:disulfide bond formation protein DsbB